MMRRFLALSIVLVLTVGATALAGDEPVEQAEVCRRSATCHREHPAERIDCPGCERRRIPANDAGCLTCSNKKKVCRHCGRPRPGKKASATSGWAKLPCRVEQVGENVYLSFQPVRVIALRLNRDAARVAVYGMTGKLDATIRAGVIQLAAPAEVAEVTLFGSSAKGLECRVPRASLTAGPKKPKKDDLEELGSFKPTFYWVLQEERFDGERNTPLLGPDGKEIGRFASEFVRLAKIEGTAKLRDGRVVNVWGKGRWKVVDAPNGLGTKGYHLIPFRSVAVDRNEIPIGTPLFIPEAVGMRLPDGRLHDGYFYAHDVGGGIKGRRIDLFTGMGRQQDVFAAAGIRNMRALTIYRVRTQ